MTREELYVTISKKLNSNNFLDFMERYNMSYNEMLGLIDYGIHSQHISLLQCCRLKELLKQKQCSLKLTDTKIGIISDTHIGNSYMNWDYIKKAYDIFDREGVSKVLHLGDLLDAFPQYKLSKNNEEHNQLVMDSYEQILEFADCYPKELATYVLLGNHDEQFSSIGINLWDQISTRREDINLLGYGGAYIDCNDFIFYLEHPVKCSTLVPPKFDYDLILRGHAHFFRYKERINTLNITACSDLKTTYSTFDSIADPGCAIITFSDDAYTIDGYSFQPKSTEKCVLLKKRKY